jgi:hypothetical protein
MTLTLNQGEKIKIEIPDKSEVLLITYEYDCEGMKVVCLKGAVTNVIRKD